MAGVIPTLQETLDAVCDRFDVTVDDLRKPDRTMDGSYPRLVFYYLAREVCGATLVDIGKVVSRDHSSVHSGWLKMSRRMRASTAVRADVTLLAAQLRRLANVIGSEADLYGRVYIEGGEPVDILAPYLLRLDADGRPLAIYLGEQREPVLTWNKSAGVMVHRFLTNDHREVAA